MYREACAVEIPSTDCRGCSIRENKLMSRLMHVLAFAGSIFLFGDCRLTMENLWTRFAFASGGLATWNRPDQARC